MKEKSFGFLNTHSHYSLLNGIMKIPELVSQAKKAGCTALALTDISNMYGAIEFYKECEKNDIKPILGVSIFIETDSELHPHTILLAKNELGYTNLLKIITLSQFNEDKSTQPSIKKEQLIKNSEGLIQIIPYFNSEITQEIVKGDINEADKIINEYKKCYREDLYIGISPFMKKEETKSFAQKVGLKTILQFPIFYAKETDSEIRGVVLRIKQVRCPEDEDEVLAEGVHIRDRAEISDALKDDKDILDNLSEMIDSVQTYLKFGEWIFPNIKLENKETPEEELKYKVADRMKNRQDVEKNKETEDRIKLEMDIINAKGYAPYFLAVMDIIDFMRKKDIPTTTRGSAAGSLVSYITGITNVNPILYKIPFERFLNPFRPSAPDIDIDIADNKRNEVIEYISNHFGKDKVAQIGTFGSMMARAAIRDTARALSYSYTIGDRLAKLVPLGKQGFPVTIDSSLKEIKEFRKAYEEETPKKIIDLAKRIEGNARHLSKHAAGVVISPDKLINRIPLEKDSRSVEEKPITQYDMRAVEDIGLLKFDILGITNLAVLADARDRVNKRFNKKIVLNSLPLDDKKTYEFMSAGHTTAIFQLGGNGITNYIKQLRPESINDIAAIIALYRPGPMSVIPQYIKRKNGEEKVSYFHPSMEKYLKPSYGLLVYQDDLLYTAMELANYDWKEVDVFRKAVGKKIPELMARQETEFKERCVKHSKMKKTDVDYIWELFDPFKAYGFNKAHAFSYALISYQTAYMKANYTTDYMAAVLTSEFHDSDKTTVVFQECKRLGIKILPPDINKSNGIYEVETSNDNDAIRIGLYGIKNFGTGAADEIIKARSKEGKFKNLEDFIKRAAKANIINKKSMEALIQSGALNEFGSRSNLLFNLPFLLSLGREHSDTVSNDQIGLFNSVEAEHDFELQPGGSENEEQNLFWEKTMLGTYISGHPVIKHLENAINPASIENIKRMGNGEPVELISVITKIKKVVTKKGSRMLFITLEDVYDTIMASCDEEKMGEYEELLAENKCISIQAKIWVKEEERTLVIDKLAEPTY